MKTRLTHIRAKYMSSSKPQQRPFLHAKLEQRLGNKCTVTIDLGFRYAIYKIRTPRAKNRPKPWRLFFPFNPILHTWFRDSCFTCDGSPTIQVFPLIFYIGMVI
jgi:hypothetical protein